MRTLPEGSHALVVGAGGGLGGAVLEALRTSPAITRITAWSRRPLAVADPGVAWRSVDITDEAQIAAAAASLAETPLRLVFVATGVLHAGTALQPEKSMRALASDSLAELFLVNTIGPALVAKHTLPLLPREERAVFAALGARVGSISDNRSGGWHGYRASKAALAMMLRCLALELAVKRPQALCVGLHPGTVDTALSRPFQRGVAPEKLFTPAYAATRLLDVLDQLQPPDTGHVFAWDGTRVPA